MNAKENTEDVLRRIHILFSKAEPYQTSTRRVVIDKVDLMDLLKQLNACIYEMMEEYEMTQQTREKAEREMKKHGEDIVFDARKDADDIYAASMMYTDRALKNIQDSMDETVGQLENLLMEAKKAIEEQKVQVHDNQLDLRAKLQDMIDSDKYLRLIQDENLRLEKEKEIMANRQEGEEASDEETSYKDIVPEIRVNPAYDPSYQGGDELPELTPEEMADLDRMQEDLLQEKGEMMSDAGLGKSDKSKPFSLGGLFGKT